MNKKAIYISGPITGVPNGNRPAFNAEAARLRALGHYVVNPAEIELDDIDATWADYMRADLVAMLTECNTLVMLPGWRASKGATIEHDLAEKLGFEITYADVPQGEVAA